MVDTPCVLETTTSSCSELSGAAALIPPELLSSIFLECVSSELDHPSLTYAPTTVSQVCGYWRSVAISEPRLWTSLRIVPKGRTQFDIIKLWITRSATHPLTISLSLRPELDSSEILTLLVPHSSRWRCLELDIPLPFLSHLHSAQNHLDFLQCLSLTFPTKPGLRTTSCSFNIFDNAPNLTQLRGLWSHTAALGETFPFARITKLSVRCTKLAEFQKAITLCSNLVDLSVHCDWKSSLGSLSPNSPILLDSLEKLALYLPHRTAFGTIFDKLTLPRLQSLEIEDPHCSCLPWPEDSFSRLVERSQFSLQHLSLIQIAIEDDVLADCLRLTPNLIEFRLQVRYRGAWPALTNSFLSHLTIQPDGTDLVPRLQILALDGRFTFNTTSFLTMTRSRWDPKNNDPRVFTTLRLPHHVDLTRLHDMLNELLIMKDNGMSVRFPVGWPLDGRGLFTN